MKKLFALFTQKPTPLKDIDEFECWDLINNHICPNCRARNRMYISARGGAAENRVCDRCRAKYWFVPEVREFGAKRLNS